MTFPRLLKVGNSYNRAKSQEYHIAEIKLHGLWLKELNFFEGNFFTVSIEDGKLILSPDPAPSPEEIAGALAEKRALEPHFPRFYYLVNTVIVRVRN